MRPAGLIVMLSLWLIVLASVLTSTSSVKVLNVNWKCTDGAPCLNVVRPRGAFAVINADQDSFKLAISVHRPELARERLLKKWGSALGTIWNVEVAWFRLVEKGVRISMQHCKYKLVCVVPLLDDEAMARSDETFVDTGLVSHHFLVTAKYEGHKAVSEQEIIIEREASGIYQEFKPGIEYKEPKPSNQPRRPLIPPSISKGASDQHMQDIASPANIGHSDLQGFLDDKKEKASETLINSGLYSDSDEVDMIPSLYPVEDTPGNLPSLQSDPDQNSEKILDAKLNHNIHAADNEDAVVILPKNKTTGVSEQVKGFLTDIFMRLGPTATVIIVLVLAIIMACLCTCGANRIMKRYHAKGTREYIKMKENEASTSTGKTKQSKKPNSPSKRKEKPPSPRDTSWFWSKYQRKKHAKGAPNVSAGIQETFATYSKAVGKFLRGGRATDKAEYQPLVSDVNVDNEYDGSEEDYSQNFGFGQRMKKTGSRIFEKIQSNEQFRNFKTRVRDNPVFTGGKNAVKNISEGKGFMGNTSVLRAKTFCKRLTQCLATLLSPILYIGRYVIDFCCGWCQENQLQKLEKKRNAKVRAFMPSRGPSSSTSSSDVDSSSDEVNLYTKEKPTEKTVTFCLVNENETEKRHDVKKTENNSTKAKNNTDGSSPSRSKQVTPKTDISGRFNSSQPVKVFRDSGQGTASNGLKKVLYPSGHASHNDQSEPSLTQLDESILTNRSKCEEHLLADKANSASTDSKTRTTSEYDRHGDNNPSPQQNIRSVLPPPPKSQDQGRPSLPPRFPMRISRTPPPLTTPGSSTSSDAIELLSDHGNSTCSFDSSSLEDSKTSSSEKPHRGNRKKSDLTALERTKEHYRLEKQHMNKLLRVWEARTRPRKMVVDTTKQGRSREWLSHERRRRRQLRLQQEARFVRNNDKKGIVHLPSLSNNTFSRATLQKTLTVGNRLRMPVVDGASGTSAPNVSAGKLSISSRQKQVSSYKDPLIQSQSSQNEETSNKSHSRLYSESDHSDVSISSFSSRSMEASEEGITSVSISLTDSSVSVTRENSQKQEEKLNSENIVNEETDCNHQQIDKDLTDKPIAAPSHIETVAVGSEMTIETLACDSVSDEGFPAPSLELLNTQSNVGATIAENLVWEKLETKDGPQTNGSMQVSVTKNANEISTLQDKNDIAERDASMSAHLITSDPDAINIPEHEASLTRTLSSCKQDSSMTQSSVQNEKKMVNLPMHTIIEIPESNNSNEQICATSNVCSREENLKIVRKKSPSFNPFTFWKKDKKTDSSPKERFLLDQNQHSNSPVTTERKRSTSNSRNSRKGLKKCIKTTQNKISSSGQDRLIMATPERTQKKGKSGKVHENSKKKTNGCMSGIVLNSSNSKDASNQKSSSIFKMNSKLSGKSSKSSASCDVTSASGFVLENERHPESVIEKRSTDKRDLLNIAVAQNLVVTSQPVSMRTSSQNEEREQTSKNSRLHNTTNVAEKCTRKTRPDRQACLVSDRQRNPLHISTSEMIPPLNFGESWSSNDDNEYLSIPNSPTLTDKQSSKTDDVIKHSVSFPNSPRYYTMHPNTFKKLPPDRATRRVTPRTALKLVAADFLYADDYESFASSDDNDEFWKVEV